MRKSDKIEEKILDAALWGAVIWGGIAIVAHLDRQARGAKGTSGIGAFSNRYDDLLPTVSDYSRLLDIAQNKFGISREAARKKYGLYTVGQWKDLLGIGAMNPNRNGTRVIFRKYPDGEIIALFPDESWDGSGRWWYVSSYTHNGQHGGANYPGVMNDTKPAKPNEYADLLSELRMIGYDDLVISKKQ